MMKFSNARASLARGVVVFALAILAVAPAMAQTADTMQNGSRWWVRAGAAWVDFDENVGLSAGGASVPGANAKVKNNATFLVETGYRFYSDWSVGLTVGYPPTTTLTGTGTVSAVGKVGEVKYAPAALTLQYQITGLQKYNLFPYVGAGVTYVKIFSSTDGNVSNFHADSAWGRLLQAGLEYKISENMGIFLDVKKFFVSTTATGNLGPAPVTAAVRLDPLVTTLGLSYHF